MKQLTWIIFAVALVAQAGEITVTASGFESKAHGGFADFPPEKTLDGDLTPNSSWRVEVENTERGEWIQYDLGEVKNVVAVGIKFLSGKKRNYKFKIETSVDGNKWSEVFSGASDGQDRLESFETGKTSARYVRLTGYGNTGIGAESPFPKWFNIVEARIETR